MRRKNSSRKSRKCMIGGDFTSNEIEYLVAMGFNSSFPDAYADIFNAKEDQIRRVIYWYIIKPENGVFTEAEKRNITPNSIIDELFKKYSLLYKSRSVSNQRMFLSLKQSISDAKNKFVNELSGTEIYTLDNEGNIVGQSVGYKPNQFQNKGGKRRYTRRNKNKK
jgi:hypothetical protein